MRAADRVEAEQEDYAWTIAREGSKTIREARREPPRAATILRLARGRGDGNSPAKRCRSTCRPDRRTAWATTSGARSASSSRSRRSTIHWRWPRTNRPRSRRRQCGGHQARIRHSAVGFAAGARSAGGGPAARTFQRRDRLRTRRLATALVTDPRVRMVTRSPAASTPASRLRGHAGIKKLSMELGSNSPVIVLPDADLGRAAAGYRRGRVRAGGAELPGCPARVRPRARSTTTFKSRFIEHVARSTAGSSLDEASRRVRHDQPTARRDGSSPGFSEADAQGARVLAGGRSARARSCGRRSSRTFPPGCGSTARRPMVRSLSLYRWRRSTRPSSARTPSVRIARGDFHRICEDAFTAVQRLAVGGRHRERLDRLSARCHAVWRHEAQWHRPRRDALRGRGDDRNARRLLQSPGVELVS